MNTLISKARAYYGGHFLQPWNYQPQQRKQPYAAGPTATRCVAMETQQLLDAFWEARGVFDAAQRQRLVEAARDIKPLGDVALIDGKPLPGIPSAWSLHEATPEVVEVSRRLVGLQALLGGPHVDVVWMVVREPRLLTADFGEVTRRLVDMKIASAGTDIDVVSYVEKQPALLLTDNWKLDLDTFNSASGEASGGVSSSSASSSSSSSIDQSGSAQQALHTQLQELVQAWEFGLSNDGDADWKQRYRQLQQYQQQHGDASVGFRDGDDPELARWASKQRAQHKAKELPEDKVSLLQQVGFEFSEDEAEWARWFAELQRFQQETGESSPMPLATGVDMYLINWCGIQRIAKRSRVLSASRIARLDAIQFDWSGADPLS